MKPRIALVSLVTGSVIGFLLAAIIFVIVADDVSRLPVIQAVAAAGALLGISVAALTYALNSHKHVADTEWNRSKLAMDSAITLVERAYEILTVDDKEKTPPPNDRYVWLTSARHILASQGISKDITESTHKKVFEEHLEYWRTRFYSVLSPLGKAGGPMPEAYFAEKPEHVVFAYSDGVRSPIAEKSLAVIFRFIEWPKDKEDRLQDVPLFTDEEIKHYRLFAHEGLGRHLELIRAYEKQLAKRGEKPA